IEAAVRTGEAFEVQYRLRHRSGDIRSFSEQGRAILDEGGRPLFIDGVIFDVTDRQHQQERLREREAQLQAFFDSNAVLMSIMALAEDNLVFVRPNETMAAFYGMTARELTGKTCREIGVAEDVIAFWLERFRKIHRTGQPLTLEYDFARDGVQRWYHGTISPIATHSSPLPLFALATVEITERRRAELALRESEGRFREVLETSLDASYRRDLQTGKYDYFSPVFQDIADYTPEEMSGLDTEATLALVHPEDRPAVIEELEKALESEVGFVEYRFRSKSGDYLWLGDKIRVVRDAQGVPLYRVGVVRDITHRKQVEEALIQAKTELEERVRQRTAELEIRADQLARLTSELTTAEQRERRRMAQVIHDHLQQLLVGAKFGLDVLSRRIDPKQLATVKQVEKLLNESINTARSLTAELSPPILHEAGLQAALEWLVRWMREKYGLTVEFVSDGKNVSDREDVRILLFQSVREALFNVVKHAKVIHAHVTLTHPDFEHVQVVVRDEGAGFDTENLSFESGRATGGFGLVSIRERLALLGGTLQIESTIQQGTVVTLTVPVAPLRRVVLRDDSRHKSPQKRTDESGPDRKTSQEQSPIRVLLVDDHVVMRQGLSMLLGDESDLLVIGEASNGTEAIAAARELRPDVILMDFGMPQMNGVEATRIIHKEFPKIRIIGLSMYEEADRAAAMLEAGATAYLSKSGRSEVLLHAIREIRKE
ncbi:MAG: PAS domain S-box protein, partial [Acidobacteriota bacterium]